MNSIEVIIKQAEMRKLELELQNNFLQNIQLFAERFPQIANKFTTRKPNNIFVKIDANNNLNLYKQSENIFMYSDSPFEYCRRQVEIFIENPKINRLHLGESSALSKKHLHPNYVNKLLDVLNKEKIGKAYTHDKRIINLLLTSTGIGYQLSELINTFDIKNLQVYERDLDMFQATLFTINWKPILDYFNQDNHSITFYLGVDPGIALTQVQQSIDDIGLHNHLYTHIFQHTKSKVESDFIKYYKDNIYSASAGLGYYDDEQIGLAHTIHNLKSKTPIFVCEEQNKIPEDLPAVIIGNGPSLDMHIDLLKENQNNLAIFSGGSSFGSLVKIGIKPDFHVEMERTIYQKDSIDFASTQEDRDNVTLLCLNTVAPAVINSFEEACYALKPNDVSETLIDKYFSPKKIVKLPYCNPTVTNCALSYAISMGFKTIYLVGVDLAFPNAQQHHSKHSALYKFEKIITDDRDKNFQYPGERIKIKGNFQDLVETHPILGHARSSMEKLLFYTHSVHKDFRCYNSNDGAYIENTIPVKIDDIHVRPVSDKSDILKAVKGKHFYSHKNKKFEKSSPTLFLKHFYKQKQKLKLSDEIRSDAELYLEAQRIFQSISKDKDHVTNLLLRGTVSIFLGIAFQYALYAANQDDFLKVINKIREAYNSLIDEIYENMTTNPFKLDDSHSPSIQKLKEENEAKSAQNA